MQLYMQCIRYLKKWSRSYIATECLQFNKLEITSKNMPSYFNISLQLLRYLCKAIHHWWKIITITRRNNQRLSKSNGSCIYVLELHKLQNIKQNVKYVSFADDLTGAGKLQAVIMEGPKYDYFLKASKWFLIVKREYKHFVKHIFRDQDPNRGCQASWANIRWIKLRKRVHTQQSTIMERSVRSSIKYSINPTTDSISSLCIFIQA